MNFGLILAVILFVGLSFSRTRAQWCHSTSNCSIVPSKNNDRLIDCWFDSRSSTAKLESHLGWNCFRNLAKNQNIVVRIFGESYTTESIFSVKYMNATYKFYNNQLHIYQSYDYASIIDLEIYNYNTLLYDLEYCQFKSVKCVNCNWIKIQKNFYNTNAQFTSCEKLLVNGYDEPTEYYYRTFKKIEARDYPVCTRSVCETSYPDLKQTCPNHQVCTTVQPNFDCNNVCPFDESKCTKSKCMGLHEDLRTTCLPIQSTTTCPTSTTQSCPTCECKECITSPTTTSTRSPTVTTTRPTSNYMNMNQNTTKNYQELDFFKDSKLIIWITAGLMIVVIIQSIIIVVCLACFVKNPPNQQRSATELQNFNQYADDYYEPTYYGMSM